MDRVNAHINQSENFGNIYIVLVELKIPENVGFIARAAKNFGFKNLCLYRCMIDDRTYSTASHARDLLDRAVYIDDLQGFLSKMNHVIGTTGITAGEYRYFRQPVLSPEDLSNLLKRAGKTAILFGREDFGLLSDEIELCHAIVNIPTSPEYPVMNVSHAAAVILYEISKIKLSKKPEKYATVEEIEVFLSNLVEMLKTVQYPPHRIRRTIVVFRRVLGRAKVRQHEILTLNGILRKTVSYIKRKCKS
jgi:TrmH family RNA methyltransferase